jgi:hypothetical protein
MEPAEVHVDPVHDEFFKAQDLADALVRESIQNSLDARVPRSRSPVRVRFRFATGAQAVDPEAAQQYFDGLETHLQAVAKSIHSSLPRPGEPVPYLVIEDFGTRGLTGDPHVDPELDALHDERNDFFYFWRNVGRSSKGEVDRGRWGLGKAVFTVASRIRTIFGLTRRIDDHRSLLLGQSVLKTHVLEGERIYPYGFFARYERRHGLPLPIEDPILLDRFADDFSVHRFEPGLSIVVPYFRDDELSPDRVIESVVDQYFYPILRGDLVVEIVDGTRVQRIAHDTLDGLFARDTRVGRLCDLTRWSLEQKDENRIVLADRGVAAPRWDESVLEPPDLAVLRERFASGERLAFRIPILVKRKRARPASSWFDVYLEQDDSLRRADHHFIRRGITIPDIRANGDKPVRALIVVDDHQLSTFLGDAENPAHSDWSERADKIRTLYDHGPFTLRFVKNSAAFLASLLARPAAGRVRDFLADLFSIEMPEEAAQETMAARVPIRGSAAGASSDGTTAGSGNAAGAARVTIAKVAGGFTIKSADPSMVGRPMRGEVAYRARAGNPFRKHSPFDFDLTSGREITVHTDGAMLRPTAVNAFELVPTAARFQISMKGFDQRRDLVVRLVDTGDAAETELH